jgi:hypothetical protein
MKALRLASCTFACAALLHAGDDLLDRAEQALSVSAFNDSVRARLSGTVDLEGYSFPQPAPALIDADGHTLLVPRLSLFLDAQLGAQVYVFAQTRWDRGFDPTDEGGEVRLDEAAIRFTPSGGNRLNIQIGKFATVVGNWTGRHASWTNPFITAPLLYEHLTGIWDAEAARSSVQLLQWSHVRPGLPAAIVAREKYLRVPVIWGPSYAAGAAVSGELGWFHYAAEVKHAALASRPDAWTPANIEWDHPTVSTHIGVRPDAQWDIGVSASAGSYLRPSAARTLAPGHGRGDYRQLVLGQDTSFAWHHVQVWAEWYAARYEVPTVGHADVLAYYVEAKYRFTPQFSGAVRWNEELFGSVRDRTTRTRWGRNASRLDVAPAWRLTAHAQFKLQYSVQQGDTGAGRANDQLWAGQFTVRF